MPGSRSQVSITSNSNRKATTTTNSISLSTRYILTAVVCYVFGQVLIKMDTDRSPFRITCFIAIGLGIMGILGLSRECISDYPGIIREGIDILALLAAVAFFLGNLYWVSAIRTGMPMGHVRIVMTGAETVLLILLGFALFHEDCVKPKQLFGIGLIIGGCYFLIK